MERFVSLHVSKRDVDEGSSRLQFVRRGHPVAVAFAVDDVRRFNPIRADATKDAVRSMTAESKKVVVRSIARASPGRRSQSRRRAYGIGARVDRGRPSVEPTVLRTDSG